MTLRSIVSTFVLLGVISGPASAQVPIIKVYSVGTYSQERIGCYPAGTLTHLYVVLENWTTPFSAVDFSIAYPSHLIWLADVPAYDDGTVIIGNSPTGIAIAWGNCCMPDPSSGRTLLLTPLVFVSQQCDCNVGFFGSIVVTGYTPLGKQNPSLIRYPDLTEVSGLGSYSYMCGPIATEPTTWGKVKSLYR
jgi:hypothetical protein